MMKRGHQVVGVTFGVGALTMLPQLEMSTMQPYQTVLFFIFVLFGSLLPDIDTPKSTFGQKFWWGLMILFSFAFLLYLFAPQYLDMYRYELKVFVLFMLPVLIMVRSHRKMTHSLLFIGLLTVYSVIIERWLHIPWVYLSGLIIGAVSHLFADYLTKKGIPFIYPWSKKHYQFPITFRTGSVVESLIVYSLVLWNVWFLTSIIL